MSHDITFCITLNCPYRFTCKRFIENNIFAKGELISQQEFPHTQTNCDFYIRKED